MQWQSEQSRATGINFCATRMSTKSRINQFECECGIETHLLHCSIFVALLLLMLGTTAVAEEAAAVVVVFVSVILPIGKWMCWSFDDRTSNIDLLYWDGRPPNYLRRERHTHVYSMHISENNNTAKKKTTTSLVNILYENIYATRVEIESNEIFILSLDVWNCATVLKN